MKKGNVVTGILAVVFLWVLYQLWLPTLSIAYADGALFFGICIIVIAGVIGVSKFEDNEKLAIKIPSFTIIIVAVILVVGSIIGSSAINNSVAYSQIGEVEAKSFVNDIVEIDNSQISTVDIKLAAKLADKKLGEDIGLGSQMEVGKFTNKQSVNGKLVYVAPLEHTGIFKWMSNSEGTTGYVVVSATNSNDVQLVREVDGKSIKLKYIKSAFFSSDLKRHIRNQGYRTVGLTEYSFELDDNGYPYYVVTTYKNKTIWGLPEATGVVICDAQSGECKWYPLDEVPDWVDIVQPENFIKNQLANYGRYVHGWFNPSNKDELSVTKHITTVYNNGQCYYYTGMSSVGNDEGTVGFIMVNTRDKSAVMYRMVGVTESGAMRSAEGAVQDMGYAATTPIPLNVGGMPTYFLMLKDNEGLVKSFSMINIEKYSNVAVGKTIAETKRSYINTMNSNGNNVVFTDEAYGYTKEGIVTRITANIEGGDSYYYMVIDNDMTKLYMASMVSEELPVTREGDKVKVSYIDESNGTINIVSFDNLELSQEISPAQQNKNDNVTNIIEDPGNKIIEVDPEENKEFWDNLSDEEKAQIIKEQQKEGE